MKTQNENKDIRRVGKIVKDWIKKGKKTKGNSAGEFKREYQDINHQPVQK